MNYKMILHTMGWTLGVEAAALLLPLCCALIYGEPTIKVFVICIALCVLFGSILINIPIKHKSMYAREGFVTVALSWIIMSIFGALPFILSGQITNVADAIFETVSGFTTTGASILSDLSNMPKSLLFWRSFTHWIGGMGVLVFLVAILPLAGGNNLHLIKAESPGPAVSKLVPKVKTTAKLLYQMYIVITVAEIICLKIAGLDLFESLTLSFGTAGTGGFGITNGGIADYSACVQNIITVFMILFGIDFSLYYLLLLGKIKDVLHSDELKAYLGIILLATIVITFNCRGVFTSTREAIHHVAFQVASIITTTGYSTFDFDIWPELSKTILILLMFSGACAGSTGGGIKVSRIMIFLKSIIKEIKTASHPRTTHKITMNGRTVEHEVVRSVNVYMAAYIAIFVFSLLIISIDNFDFTTNFTAVLATLNNIGPGLAKVGPTQNFSGYSMLSTIVLTFDMLIGRLEIFPILILFSPSAWRK